MLKLLGNLVSTITKTGNVKYHSKFSDRIRNRHRQFWEAADAEIVRNTLLHAHDPIEKWKDAENWQRKLSNKYNSREFAKKHGCKVAELYWKGRNINELPFDKLPDHYVIRPTIGHSCQLVFLMSGTTNLMDKKTYSHSEIAALLKEQVAKNPYLEFLVEEFIRTEDGEYKIPKDYKFYMFSGQIARIEVINRISSSEGRTSLYNEHWEQMVNIGKKYGQNAVYEEPPQCLPELIEQAKTLSKAYDIFVRIDFYATDKGAVFGEFTPTPGVGKFFTNEADAMFEGYWARYCKNKI